LIIQMKAGTGTGGATINRTNTSSYGTVTAFGGAGNYEFATISTVSGSTVTFTKALVNTYDPAGSVQLIPTNAEGTVAPNAANYTTSATLRAMEYDEVNGVGGVFVLSTSGTLTLSNDINVDTLGFQGGDTLGNVALTNYIKAGCCVNTGSNASQMDAPDGASYFMKLTLSDVRYDDLAGPPDHCPDVSSDQIIKGSRKGRGIFGVFANEELGKGVIANGGGGAHGFNSGGGGGGGYAAGGNGGYENSYSCDGTTPSNLDNGGRGGSGYNGGATSIFMGGGAGAGQGDGASASFDGKYKGPSSGGDGAGIIIIKASQIIGGGHIISAKGGSARTSEQDGAGGGGGGGSILLDVPTFSGALTVDASGGKGGDAIQSTVCHGTGGGGGGGRVVFPGAAPGGVTVNTASGLSGNVVQNTAGYPVRGSTCLTGVGVTYGAGAGTIGAVLTGNVNTQPCTTPVTLLNFSLSLLSDNSVGLYWKTASEKNSSYFLIERSSDGQTFEGIGSVQAHGNSGQVLSYSFTDDKPSTSSGYVYYRLRMVDLDGSFEYSNAVSLKLKGTVVSVYPNPVRGEGGINVVYLSDMESELTADIVDLLGRHVNGQLIKLTKGTNEFKLSTEGLSKGIYLVYLGDKYGKTIEKIIIE
jgi:Secretion system C-terminal sorting domain